MDIAEKVLGFLAACLALLATIAVTYILRWWVPQQANKVLRGEIEYYVGRLEDKDKELAEFRLQAAANEQRLKVLADKVEHFRIADRDKNSYLFGLERYVKRLETLCLKQKLQLPSRENGEGE